MGIGLNLAVHTLDDRELEALEGLRGHDSSTISWRGFAVWEQSTLEKAGPHSRARGNIPACTSPIRVI